MQTQSIPTQITRLKTASLVACLHSSLLTICISFASAQSYTVTDLGVPGGRPQAVGEQGTVVGWFSLSGATRAFAHNSASGTYSDIGVLPGMSFAAARAINTAGQIVGSSWPTAINQPGRAFRYTPGVGMVDLGVLSGTTSEAFCVDDLGNVGGRAAGTAFTPEAFYQVAGSSMQSVVPGSSGTTHDITASGWRVGVLGNNQAFYVQPSGTLSFVPLPSATPLGRATAVSESGWIVGEMSDPSGSPSYAYRFHVGTGVVENLGSISRFGTVTGVDSQGTVVAIRRISISSTPVAMISFGGAQMVAIDTLLTAGSQWSIRTVSDINEKGSLCGTAALISGASAPVRLDLVVTGTASSSLVVGSGCSNIVVRASAPRVGRPWQLTMHGASAGQAMFSLLSSGHHSPIPLAGSACDIYLSASSPVLATFATTNAIGQWASALTVPSNPAVVGAHLTHQIVVAAPGTVFGLVATEANQAVVGS